MANIEMRYTTLDDTPYLQSWLSDERVKKWFPMESAREQQDAIQCWMGFSRYSSSLTATIDGEPVAIGTLFLMPYKKVSHHCLFKMVVDPKHWRKGIGTDLLKNLKHLAKEYFKLDLIHIEIFGGNPIEKLLNKQGFVEYGRQKDGVKVGDSYLERVVLECDL